MKTLLPVLMTGVVATALADLWALLRRSLFGTPLPNYRLVGRWVGRMAQGEWRHQSIANTASVRGELWIGWSTHYGIGVLFAALAVLLFGTRWLNQPTLPQALLIGLATVAAPFLVMQPAMGLGVAASRAPRPWLARLHSLAYHLVFGLGMFVGALVANAAFG